MKHYSPTGRRNYGRPLKRLLDTWDRNGSTSGPTPWQIYGGDDDDDDDVPATKKKVLNLEILRNLAWLRSVIGIKSAKGYFQAILHKSVKHNHIYLLLKHDYMFRYAQTIIRTLLQNFQTEAKYIAIMFTICDPTCVTVLATAYWCEWKWQSTDWQCLKFSSYNVIIS